MRYRPILFSAGMVRAIMGGRKTQTRRVIKPQPPQELIYLPRRKGWSDGVGNVLDHLYHCPYGQHGDRLWVRETWKPSIFMPRWASRITLEVTGVSVERVQDISGSDCCLEGVTSLTKLNMMLERTSPIPFHEQNEKRARWDFRCLWDSINGKPRKDGTDISLQANPWVWVVEFKVMS